MDFHQRRTFGKCRSVYALHSVGDIQLRQAGASIEGPQTDGCYCGGYGDAFQVGATTQPTATYFCQCRWQCDIFQFAAHKSRRSNVRHRCRNLITCSVALCRVEHQRRHGLVEEHTILANVFGISFFHGDAPQSCTSYECCRNNVGQRFRKGQFLHAGTVEESIISYPLHILWNVNVFQLVASCESPVADLGDIVGQPDRCQFTALIESVFPQ